MKFQDMLNQSGIQFDEQQLRALYADTNTVVSAGAGSGKTTVLSYRFLRLLTEQKAHADEILTLTFTRKAASEMHERIHKRLLEWKHDEHISVELQRFPDASISTLDSFCSSIVRADCMRYGITEDFSVDENQNKDMLASLADKFLSDYRNHRGVQLLASLYTPDVLIEEVLIKLGSDFFPISRPLCASVVSDSISTTLLGILTETLNTFLARCERILLLSSEHASVEEAKRICLLYVEKVPQLLEAGNWQDIAALLDRDKIWTRPRITKADGDHHILRDIHDSWKTDREKIVLAAMALTTRDEISDIYDAVIIFQDQVLKHKRRTSILSFQDVALLAVDILLTNKELRTYFKQKFTYIMIDEFQDNNQLQRDLLFLLAEKPNCLGDDIPAVNQLQPNKLFFVGDEKQSIYRFRGADVSVFKQLMRELVCAGGELITLNTNYRSAPRLIEYFNALFPQVMEHDNQLFEADFSALSSKPVSHDGATITLCFKERDSDESAELDGETSTDDEAEAVHLANLIEKMLTTDKYLIPGPSGNIRPKPDDIAILLRSTGAQINYEKALRSKKIPYTLQMARMVFMEAPANDLYQILQLIIYPSDKLAYAASLRSPLCGVGDQAVFELLKRYDEFGSIPYEYGDDSERSWFDAHLSDEDKQKYFNTAKRFNELVRQSASSAITRLLFTIWYEWGYRYHILKSPAHHTYLDHYDYLWELALQYEQSGLGLSSYLDYLRPRLGKNERMDTVELKPDSIGGVQIMTIHKSKGLEFPIVIVAGMGTKQRPKQPEIHISPRIDRWTPVLRHMNYNGYYNGLQRLETEELHQQETAELKRLLYVALTRAETHLVLSGTEKRGVNAEDNPLGTLISMVLAWSPEELIQRESIAAVSAESLFGVKSKQQKARQQEIESWYALSPQGSFLCEPPAVSVTAITNADEEVKRGGRKLLELESDAILESLELQSEFGTFVHSIIESCLHEELPDHIEQLLPRSLAHLGAAEVSLIVKDGKALSQAFFGGSLYSSLQSMKPIFKSEVPVYFRTEFEGKQVVAQGIIDLIVELPNEVIVIDFKTDRFNFSRAHERQVRLYMEALRKIVNKPVKGTVCYLRDPDTFTWLM